MSLIRLDKASFYYPGAERPAINGLSLSIETGEYVAIVGRNGSGKSTLLRLLNGLKLPILGAVFVDGLDTKDADSLPAIRSRVALVFQSPQDQLVSTVVREDLAFGPLNLGFSREEVKERVTEALERTGLVGLADRPCSCLSAGQQQRLAIAGAIACVGARGGRDGAACIAFDEATSMLDPLSRLSVLDMMDELVANGNAVIHVTHDMDEAARASRVIVLDQGCLVYDGDPVSLFSSPSRYGLDMPQGLSLAATLGLKAGPRESVEELATRADPGFFVRVEGRAGMRAVDAEPPAAREEAFRVEKLCFSYLLGTKRETQALNGVAMSVGRGESLALVGKTGSGKSSLLALLNALALPRVGSVVNHGLRTDDPKADLRAIRMGSPLAIQRPEIALFETYAADDVSFGPRNQGLKGKALVERVRAWMDAACLPYASFRDRPCRSLSGGEKRKLALAGVFAMESRALLLDEPSASLDADSKREVLALVARVRKEGRTVMMATHSMEEACLMDRIAVFSEGRLACLDRPEAVFYEGFDPAWGIERPLACRLALALEARGIRVPGKPLLLEDFQNLFRPAGGRASFVAGIVP